MIDAPNPSNGEPKCNLRMRGPIPPQHRILPYPVRQLAGAPSGRVKVGGGWFDGGATPSRVANRLGFLSRAVVAKRPIAFGEGCFHSLQQCELAPGDTFRSVAGDAIE